MASLETQTTGDRTQARMQLTDWSLVSLAGGTDSPEVRDALERLCRTYRDPIYAYLRLRPGRAFSSHDADDLTQDFIAHLLEKGTIRKADHAQGRFRSFLLGSLKLFVNDHLDKLSAQKRGGQHVHVSIDDPDASESDRNPPIGEAPDTIFYRQWVNTVIESALRPLREDYASKGRADDFALLEPCILRDAADAAYADLAGKMGKTVGALKVEIHRLRDEYKKLFREEVARTVSTVAEVDDEIRAMLAAFAK